MPNRRILLYSFASMAMLFWGMSFVWSSIVFEYLTPMATILARLVLSSALLMSWLMIRGGLKWPAKRDLGSVFILALLQPFFYFLGESFGLQRTSPVIAAIVIALIPVFTPLAARLVGHEKLSIRNLAGILISFSGVALIVTSDANSAETDLIGLAFLLLAVASAVVYTIWVRKIDPGMSSLQVIAWQNFIGIFLFLPWVLIFDLSSLPLKAPDMRFALSLGSLVVLASSAAFVMYFEVIRSLGPSKANAFSNMIPAFTALFAWMVLGELLTPSKIIGMLIVISGVLLSQSGRKKGILIPGG